MSVAYSQDLRDRVLAARDRGIKTHQVAHLFCVSASWVRRVMQRRRQTGQTTPRPRGGATVVKIDLARLRQLVHEQPDATCGKAVYRRLSQGRWVVTVTGDGSLGLAKRPDHDAGPLTFSPSVKDYPQVQSEIKHQVDQIGLRDVLGKLIWPGG